MMRAAMLSTVSPLAMQCAAELADPRPLNWVGAFFATRDAPEPDSEEQSVEENNVATPL